MTRAFLGLGSNMGDRIQFLGRALAELSRIPGIQIGRISGVYETAPYGQKEQADFLNAVVEINTRLGPENLADALRGIERSVGRKASERWGPREIDIDLLYFGKEILRTAGLTLPHPEVAKRRFVLVPLAEIAPEFLDPGSDVPVLKLLAQCADRGSVKKTPFHLGAITSNEP